MLCTVLCTWPEVWQLMQGARPPVVQPEQASELAEEHEDQHGGWPAEGALDEERHPVEHRPELDEHARGVLEPEREEARRHVDLAWLG